MTRFDATESGGAPEDVVSVACAWAELIHERELTTFEREDFAQWLRDADHERESRAEFELRFRLAEVPEGEREALSAESVLLVAPRYFPERRVWRARGWALAAGIALLGLGAVWIGLSRQHYVTGVGQKRVMNLPDGTRVELSAQTELKWLGTSPCDRRVGVVRGEALFSVHNDPQCPFQVSVGHSSVEVLGTEFDVHRGGHGEERVSVLQGRVRLHGPSGTSSWQLDLGARQQARWDTGLPSTRELDDIAKAVAWRVDQLDFDDQPLGQVVDELQRYTAIPIRIADPRLLSVHVTGELRVDKLHIRASVLRLARRPEIEVTDDGHSLVLTYRPMRPL